MGRNEEELTRDGIPYEIGKANYREIARGQIIGDSSGLLKLIFNLETRELLGVHIIGAQAGDLIQECVVAMEFRAASEDIARTSHGHPGLSEIVKEAALAVLGRALHV